MSETVHPAQRLRRAEIAFDIASRRATQLDKERSLCRRNSPHRFATLSGILFLLEEASKICGEAGADSQSPLVSAILVLHDKTRRQLRNVLVAYGVIVAAASLLLGAVICLTLGVIPRDDSPVITEPNEADAVEMTISVSGLSPRRFLIPGTHLYVFVKPQGLDYWLQPPPKVDSAGWTVGAGIGGEPDRGMPFRICAILASQALPEGWHAPALPPGLSRCINVTRK